MNPEILHIDVQNFINDHLSDNIYELLLKKSAFKQVSSAELVEQIESKNRCKKKLPLWYQSSGIYYPAVVSIEQTSSQVAARYKSTLVEGEIADITGGFGVDSFYFSEKSEIVYHIEHKENLSKIAKHNFEILQRKNIVCVCENGIDFIEKTEKNWDWIYVDPSRRNSTKNKVFLLSDCQPNIIQVLPILLKKAKNILIKTSPMLDITTTFNEIKNVKSLHIVAIKNEVKELLWIINNEKHSKIDIKSINITDDKIEVFTTEYPKTKKNTTFSQIKNYLYEPNAAILKSGAFNDVAHQFSVSKLHKHTHLYTSEDVVKFPGRSFKVKHIFPFSKKNVRNLNIDRANITTRNFPISVDQIRKISHIKDGGNIYLFFTTQLPNEKIIALCEKIN